MPAGQIIGRVSVKVLPDTDDFRSDAERKLEKIERKLEVRIPTRIDMSGASRQLLEEVRKINQRNRAMDSRKIALYTRIATSNMREEISKAVRRLNAQAANQKVKIDAELGAVDIKGQLDRPSLDEVQKQIEDWRDDVSPFRVYVKPELIAGATTVIGARLAFLTRPRTVPILPMLNETAVAKVAAGIAALSGARVVADWFRDWADYLKEIDRHAPGIAAISLGVTGIAGYGLSAASNLAAMSASLAQIGPLALTLPGIFGGIAIGVGATAMALADFNKVFPDVKKSLEELQNQVSANFWAEAQAPIRELIDTLLPQFAEGMRGIATELGQWWGGLATAITGVFDGLLLSMFADLSKSIDIFTGYTPAIAEIFGILASVGAGQLPALAQTVGDLTQRFADFLSNAQATGELDQWIDTAKQNFSDLLRVVGNLGGILAGIGRAATAAGGSTLGMMADTLERVHAVVDSAGFQEGLTGVLTAAHGMMTLIAEQAGPAVEKAIGSLADIFVGIAPIAGAAIGELVQSIALIVSNPAVSTGITMLFYGIKDAISALNPLVPPLAHALGAIGTVVGALLPVIAGLLTAALGPLLEVIVSLLPAVLPIVDILGTVLKDAVTALAPVIAELGKAIGEVLVAAAPLLKKFGEIVAFILPILVPAITFLIGILADTLVMALNGLTNVIDGVLGFIKGIFALFSADTYKSWDSFWNAIKEIAFSIWNIIKGALQLFFSVGIGGIFTKGMFALKGLWRSGWNVIKDAAILLWQAIKSRFKTFLDELAAAPGNALNALKNLFKGAWDDIKQVATIAFRELKEKIVGKVDDVVSKVKEIPGLVKEGLGDLGGTLVAAGRKLIEGLIKGIGEMFGKVKGKLGELTGKFTDWKGPESLDRVLLKDAGSLIIGGLIDGLESRYEDVHKSLKGLTSDISKTEIATPKVNPFDLASRVDNGLGDEFAGAKEVKVLKYYAAPGSSLGSEEDLFAAADRARMVGW